MGKDKQKKAERHENGKDAKILKLTGENKTLKRCVADLEASLEQAQRTLFSCNEQLDEKHEESKVLKETVADLKAKLTESSTGYEKRIDSLKEAIDKQDSEIARLTAVRVEQAPEEVLVQGFVKGIV